MKISAKATYEYLQRIKEHHNLTDTQFNMLLDSAQIDDMLRAVQLVRMDQVTVMLYQDGILVRKAAVSK